MGSHLTHQYTEVQFMGESVTLPQDSMFDGLKRRNKLGSLARICMTLAS